MGRCHTSHKRFRPAPRAGRDGRGAGVAGAGWVRPERCGGIAEHGSARVGDGLVVTYDQTRVSECGVGRDTTSPSCGHNRLAGTFKSHTA